MTDPKYEGEPKFRFRDLAAPMPDRPLQNLNPVTAVSEEQAELLRMILPEGTPISVRPPHIPNEWMPDDFLPKRDMHPLGDEEPEFIIPQLHHEKDIYPQKYILDPAPRDNMSLPILLNDTRNQPYDGGYINRDNVLRDESTSPKSIFFKDERRELSLGDEQPIDSLKKFLAEREEERLKERAEADALVQKALQRLKGTTQQVPFIDPAQFQKGE